MFKIHKKSKQDKVHSNFWLGKFFDTSTFNYGDKRTATIAEAARLNNAQKAVSRFVNILVPNRKFRVVFSKAGDSYTDGRTVVIGTNVTKPKDFDVNVGVALHEASHLLLTDFAILKNFESYLPREVFTIGEKVENLTERAVGMRIKTILNVVEDRRIDNYVYTKTPGYREYYHSFYDRYFNSEAIEKALRSKLWRDETWDAYKSRLINIHSLYNDNTALKSFQKIYDLFDLEHISRLKTTRDALELSIEIYKVIMDAIEAQRNQPQSGPEGDSCDDEQNESEQNSDDSNSSGKGKSNSDKKEKDDTESGEGQCEDSEDAEDGEKEESQSGGADDQEDGDSDEPQNSDSNDESSEGDESNESGEGDESNESGEGGGDEGDSSDSDGDESEGEEGEGEDSGEQNSTSQSSSTGGGNGMDNNPQPQYQSMEERLENEKRDNPIEDINKSEIQQAIDAIKEQEEFMEGAFKEFLDEITEELEKKVQQIQETDSELKPVGEDLGKKTDCVVVNKLTDFLTKSGECPVYAPSPRYDEQVKEGIRIGKILGKRLQVRGEQRATVFNRQNQGKIDKRMVASLGYGNESVFSKVEIDMYKKANLHISIDASSSMDGSKWRATMVNVTAICKAVDMIPNLQVQVTLRATISDDGGRYGSNYLPYVIKVYDSRTDKFAKLRKTFPHLKPDGTTPEGLCFEAIVDNFVPVTNDVDSYFLNISDGQPYFGNREINYSGDSACKHTRKQVAKIKGRGIKVLSYYVDEGYGSGVREPNSEFKSMYGKDAKAINVTSVSEITKTMNKLFLDK